MRAVGGGWGVGDDRVIGGDISGYDVYRTKTLLVFTYCSGTHGRVMCMVVGERVGKNRNNCKLKGTQ